MSKIRARNNASLSYPNSGTALMEMDEPFYIYIKKCYHFFEWKKTLLNLKNSITNEIRKMKKNICIIYSPLQETLIATDVHKQLRAFLVTTSGEQPELLKHSAASLYSNSRCFTIFEFLTIVHHRRNLSINASLICFNNNGHEHTKRRL